MSRELQEVILARLVQSDVLQVSIEDAIKAEEIFSTLMGDEVAPRKKWIQGHATQVKNLDI